MTKSARFVNQAPARLVCRPASAGFRQTGAGTRRGLTSAVAWQRDLFYSVWHGPVYSGRCHLVHPFCYRRHRILPCRKAGSQFAA